MFQVALFQLAEVTLMVSVYNKRSMKKKEMIGWFSLGLFCKKKKKQDINLFHMYEAHFSGYVLIKAQRQIFESQGCIPCKGKKL